MTLASGDSSIHWADIIVYSKPVTISYTLTISSKPHTVLGVFGTDGNFNAGLKWYLSTEDTNFMFYNDMTSNQVNSHLASTP